MDFAAQPRTLARTSKVPSIVTGLILIVFVAAAMALASILPTRSEATTREPAAVISSRLVEPLYVAFRRAERSERWIHGTDWPPRPVIVPRNVKDVGIGG